MKRILLLLSVLVVLCQLKAQTTYFYNDKLVVLEGGDTLTSAFVGGFVAPQFSEIDLNGDQIKDLVVFDRSGNKLTTYLNYGIPGQAKYLYSPQYEELFPSPLTGWLLLRDYNCDGLEDVFTGTQFSGFSVWKNVGTPGKPAFKHISAELLDVDNINLYALTLDVPVIDDIDGDGDLDVISFGVLGGYAEMYRNERVERGLTCDTLVFKFVDYCWGSFAEGGLTNDIFLGENCGFKYYKNARHAGSTLTTIDIDGDGDKDLILGDIDYPELKLLINGKKDRSWPIDTIISVVNRFPENTRAVDIERFPAAFVLDLNNDGKQDMIATSNETFIAKNKNQVWLYRNTSGGNDFKFQLEDTAFLQKDAIDLGSGTQPLFLDVDEDGDLDLLIVSKGEYTQTKNGKDQVTLYENIGTPSKAVFRFKQQDFNNFSQQNITGLFLSVGDVDKDGKQDLLAGNSTGRLSWYKNTGTAASPAFTLQADSFADRKGTFTAPLFHDLDADGLDDLIVGHAGGTLWFYKNRGTQNKPSFNSSPDIDTLGRIFVNAFFYNYNFDLNGNLTDSFRVFEFDGLSAPTAADIDGDGIKELVVGARSGRVHVYKVNASNLTDSFPEINNYFQSPGGKKQVFDAGARSMPGLMDADGDGRPDLFIGNSRGGIHYLQSNFVPWDTLRTSIPELRTLNMQLYPNPNNGSFTLTNTQVEGKANIDLLDITGKKVWNTSHHFGANQTAANLYVQHLANGMYFIQVSVEGYTPFTARMVVQH